MQSLDGEQVVMVVDLTGSGLAITICLPDVTGCLLIGLKWVNSVSIELMLSLLLLLDSCPIVGSDGIKGLRDGLSG